MRIDRRGFIGALLAAPFVARFASETDGNLDTWPSSSSWTGLQSISGRKVFHSPVLVAAKDKGDMWVDIGGVYHEHDTHRVLLNCRTREVWTMAGRVPTRLA